MAEIEAGVVYPVRIPRASVEAGDVQLPRREVADGARESCVATKVSESRPPAGALRDCMSCTGTYFHSPYWNSPAGSTGLWVWVWVWPGFGSFDGAGAVVEGTLGVTLRLAAE